MSKDEDKFKHSRRLQKDDNAIAKQVKIAKSNSHFDQQDIKEPHRLVKHHVMDCGNPECYMCGNPRKTHKYKLTQQEKRLFQDVEKVTDRHSNGLKPTDE
jgi:hypothetical protein